MAGRDRERQSGVMDPWRAWDRPPWWARLQAAWSGTAGHEPVDPAVRRVLEHAAHPGSTPTVARLLVRDLSLPQNEVLWRATSELLAGPAGPATPTARLGWVLVRAEVLDHLEAALPESFPAWYAEQWRDDDGGLRPLSRSHRPAAH